MAETRALIELLERQLSDGVLNPVLQRVRRDHTLDMQFRGNEIHIYYRGGRILKIATSNQASPRYSMDFDRNYLSAGITSPIDSEQLPQSVLAIEDVEKWISAIPRLKEHMDVFFTERAEKNEREFQQLLVRDNNYTSAANCTDYFVIDTEYQNRDLGRGQADLIALKWNKDDRKRAKRVRLSLIEVKFGDDALNGSSGIAAHVERMAALVRDEAALQKLQSDMLRVFKQKRSMGLVRFGKKGNENDVEAFSSEMPEILLVLINHNPSNTKLWSELNRIPEADRSLLSFACSSFMGYGLYVQSIYSYSEFTSKFTHLLKSPHPKVQDQE